MVHQAKHQNQRPIKLKNLLNGERTMDNLHMKYKNNNSSHGCNETRCLGALLNSKPVEQRVRTNQETWEQAKDFLDGYYASIKRVDTPAHKQRLKEVEKQIKTTETYYLKETELIYGAKLAWRNAPRCIGRIQWSKLQVFDARFTRNANEMFEALCNHIKYATNKGSLRSAITIFPQRVKTIDNDWRIWNSQLISYAGYRDEKTGLIRGDPINAELTALCQRLGWQGSGGEFDVLPLVLSANGQAPQVFPLPEELVLRVKLRHPRYKWFEELGLEWYALPAVSAMMLDVGGLQFTACPFSGWYMVTEIGTRDLGDTNRFNKLELVAQRMGLNTRTNMSLWRDQAVVEMNLAVLDSFQQAGVTIVDHHTASETFMTHLANEQRLRGGCPADWVWLVPPTAGSTTQVFHQEMVNYHLLPNYEYMEPAWSRFDWVAWERAEQERKLAKKHKQLEQAEGQQQQQKADLKLSPLRLTAANGHSAAAAFAAAAAGLSSGSSTGSGAGGANELTPRHLRFKEIARAVKFTSKLFGKALSRRIKATILYATETGRSERFANKLAQTFSYAFNVHLMSMADYDMACLEHEALLLIVTSTFGNGDPPENGELFAKHLAAIKKTGDTSPDIESINSVSTNPFFQMLSEDHKDGSAELRLAAATADFSFGSAQRSIGGGQAAAAAAAAAATTTTTPTTIQSLVSSNAPIDGINGNSAPLQINAPTSAQQQTTSIRPLSNVRFAVFALGSTAYPHFCAFGRYLDQTLGELGAEQILKCHCGDELCGQEKAFNEWAGQVFRLACDTFCLTDQLEPGVADGGAETIWSPADVRFEAVELGGGGGGGGGDQAALCSSSLASLGSAEDSTAKPASGHIVSQPIATRQSIVQNLINIVGKKIIAFTVKRRFDLHQFVERENLQTICVDLDAGARPVRFKPGDHIGIYPTNPEQVVQKILARIRRDFGQPQATNDGVQPTQPPMDNNGQQEAPLSDKSGHHLALDFDRKLTILIKRGNMDPLTQGDAWVPCDTLPQVTSIREALTRYLDITNPANQEFLLILSRLTNEAEDKKRLQQLARNFTFYEEWKNKQVPTLLSLLEQFQSVRFDPALVAQIPPMKPRFYSISGESLSLTLSVVRYNTPSGDYREGLCSNYLNRAQVDARAYIYGYVRSAPAFHMPLDELTPLILIGAGTGIAPFRSFWQRRYAEMFAKEKVATFKSTSMALKELSSNGLTMMTNGNSDNNNNNNNNNARQQFGPIDLYFGCRNSNYVLYKDELEQMHNCAVLSSVNLAFSRPMSGLPAEQVAPGTFKKMYVQDKLLENGDDVFKSIVSGAHIYVCGDVAMADGVYKTLAVIINHNIKRQQQQQQQQQQQSPDLLAGAKFTLGDDGESALMNLRNLNRYHEDIFGARR